MSKWPTRAQGCGVKPGTLARKVRRFTDRARDDVRKIAYEWEEICGGVDTDCTELERAIDCFETRMKEWIDYIKERPGEQ